MPARRVRAAFPFFACSCLVAVGSASACKEPPQIVVQVSTDLPCPQPLTATVTAGEPGAALEAREPTTAAYACDPTTRQIGSVVIVPSGSKDADIGIRVVLGVDVQADQCKAPEYTGCIVARRELNFIPGATLDVPIVMHGDCKDKPCDAGSTCFQGTCVSSKISSNGCPNMTCGEGQLGGAVDAGVGDATAGDGATVNDGGPADGAMSDVAPSDAPADGSACGASCAITNIALGVKHTCVVKSGHVLCFGGNDTGQLGLGTADNNAHATPSTVLTMSGVQLTGAVGVVSGVGTTCAFLSGGKVSCWGDGTNGQLGLGIADSGAYTSLATDVSELAGAKMIAMGETHTCWTNANGNVSCMGTGETGQIGDGQIENSPVGPKAVNTGGPVQLLVAAADNTCATRASDGKILCWGDNPYNTISLMAGAASPVAPPLANLVEMRPGAIGSCGRLATGQVDCWGLNDEGLAGHGVENTDFDAAMSMPVTPGAVLMTNGMPLPPAKQITVSDGHVTDSQLHMHACAILQKDSSVWCWGDNEYGQLGAGDFNENVDAGSTANAAYPVTSSTGFTAAQLVLAGGHHTCAVDMSGQLWCWGRNSDGQLGNNVLNPTPRPTKVQLP